MSLSRMRFPLIVLTVAIFVGLFFLQGDNRVMIDVQGGAVTVDGPQGSYFSVRYEDIDTLELIDCLDRGECVDGGTRRGYSYGLWRSAALGEYTLIVRDKVDACIVITDRSGQTLAFNYESGEVTNNLYELILKLLAEQDISV